MIQLIILGKNSIKILHRPLIIDITHIKLQPSYYYTIPSYPPMNVDYNNFPEVFEFISSNKIIEKVPPPSLRVPPSVSTSSSQASKWTTMTRSDTTNSSSSATRKYPLRYPQMRSIAMKYNIIQIGLCFFIQENDKIEAYPYNFYVFPRSYKNINPVVCLQSGTMDFNSRNGMDWNRWIKDGISGFMQGLLTCSYAK